MLASPLADPIIVMQDPGTTAEECGFFVPISPPGRDDLPQQALFTREVRILAPPVVSPMAVIVVHGGPGLADHTETFSGLSRLLEGNGKPPVTSVFFWDQWGCGKSRPVFRENDSEEESAEALLEALGSLPGHTAQLDRVLEHCSRERMAPGTRVCVLGHSWGGQVVLEWLLRGGALRTRKAGASSVVCAIISNSPLDESTYEQHQRRLRENLDPSVRTYYEEEDARFCRLATGPVIASDPHSESNVIAAKLFYRLVGASDASITGQMKDWSLLGDQDLQKGLEIAPPCLFVASLDDTVPSSDYKRLRELLPSDKPHRVEILEEGGHGPFFGPASNHYFEIVREFLVSTSGS